MFECLLERNGTDLSFWIVLGIQHQHTDPPCPL
jgi:hypothetical protein